MPLQFWREQPAHKRKNTCIVSNVCHLTACDTSHNTWLATQRKRQTHCSALPACLPCCCCLCPSAAARLCLHLTGARQWRAVYLRVFCVLLPCVRSFVFCIYQDIGQTRIRTLTCSEWGTPISPRMCHPKMPTLFKTQAQLRIMLHTVVAVESASRTIFPIFSAP